MTAAAAAIDEATFKFGSDGLLKQLSFSRRWTLERTRRQRRGGVVGIYVRCEQSVYRHRYLGRNLPLHFQFQPARPAPADRRFCSIEPDT